MKRQCGSFCRKRAPKLVLDATHPYARVVTEQVAALCRELDVPYQRVLRGSEQTASAETGKAALKTAPVFVVDSLHDAVECLKQDSRSVLLTTGSKELEAFAADPAMRERIYARVLPRQPGSEKNVRILTFMELMSLPCRDRFPQN